MILVLNASPRKNGVTPSILKAIVEGIEEGHRSGDLAQREEAEGCRSGDLAQRGEAEGHRSGDLAQQEEVAWVDVNDLAIKPCVGCLQCRPDKVCVLPRDDAHRVGELIQESSVLIVGSPTYWGNITGPLKMLFDRNVPTLEYVGGKGFPKPNHKGERAIIVVASSSPWPFNLLPSQSGGAVRALKTILKASGYTIEEKINVPNSGNFAAREDKVLSRARQIGRDLT